MSLTRRTVLGLIAGATCGELSARAGAAEAESAPSPPAAKEGGLALRCLDYGLSFICNTAPFNAVRFWVESRTTIVDQQAGRSTDYYQCASCKSENTFAPSELFQKENYDFLPVLGDGRWLIFRRPVGLSPRYRQIAPAEAVWGAPNLQLREAGEVTLLDTWEKIRDATARALPIVARTEIAGAETALRAVIECPVKTMNVSLERKLYQVDTGPIAFPDLTKPYDPQIDCLRLAFVAFNAPQFADFLVEQPTPLVEEGKQIAEVHHYSNPFSLPAKNSLLAIGKL